MKHSRFLTLALGLLIFASGLTTTTQAQGIDYASLGTFSLAVADYYLDADGQYKPGTVIGTVRLNLIYTSGWIAGPDFFASDGNYTQIFFYLTGPRSGILYFFTQANPPHEGWVLHTFRIRFNQDFSGGTVIEDNPNRALSGFGFLTKLH